MGRSSLGPSSTERNEFCRHLFESKNGAKTNCNYVEDTKLDLIGHDSNAGFQVMADPETLQMQILCFL